MATDNKYDRQMRLWGPIGQKALMESRICLLNAGPTGTETLKNLVLPGCGYVCVVDPGVVTERDLANNFFVARDRLGQPRAKATLELLLEMNDDVKGDCRIADPSALCSSDPAFFTSFSLVIATQMSEEVLRPLGDLLYARGVPLLIARSYGLVGYLRSVVPEHRIIESKPDSQKEDLRMGHPFPGLRAFVDELDLGALDDMVHGHVPYVAILVKALDAWHAARPGAGVLKTAGDRETLKAVIRGMARGSHQANFAEALDSMYLALAGASLRGGAPSTSGSSSADGAPASSAAMVQAYLASADPDLVSVLEDPAAQSLSASSPPFWFVVAALRQFLSAEGALPLSGTLPDMTATTDLYVGLQRVYQAKAAEDLAAVTQLVGQLVTAAGAAPGYVPSDLVASMCRNARNLRVVRYRSLAHELAGASAADGSATAVVEGLRDECESARAAPQPDMAPVAWYWQLRAADRFYAAHRRFPGTPGSLSADVLAADAAQLHALVGQVIQEQGLSGSDVEGVVKQEQAVETTRYGACELHVTAALVGGVASQEAVKLITHQYIPLNNTYIYNGIAGCAYQPTGGCGAPKWAPRYGLRFSTYSYCFERCQVPWFINNTEKGLFAGLVGIDHYFTRQGTDHCVNGTGLPNEWDAQDELTVAWKSVFPQMRVLQYRITTAVPYAMPVHDFIHASPDNAVAWPNGSLCQMWFSDNDTLGPDGKPKCAVDIRASAFNWANPAVRDWWIENAIKPVMTHADGAWIDGDGPDNGGWGCSGSYNWGKLPAPYPALDAPGVDAFCAGEVDVVNAAQTWLIANGGTDYNCFNFIDDATRLPNATDTPAQCAAKVAGLQALRDSGRAGNTTVLYGDRTDSRGYDDATAAQAVAVFHLVRGEHWYLGLLSTSDTMNATTAALMLTDYGAPAGNMTRTGNVFSRAYAGATVALDCDTFTASFTPAQ